MARKPAPQLSDQVNPIRQVALELRLHAEIGKELTADKAVEMADKLDAHIDAVAAAIIKARNSLTYGAEYDPLNA